MKRCPACHSTYTDETLVYCLQDGVPLEESETDDGPETVVRVEPPKSKSESQTVAIPAEKSADPAFPVGVTQSNSESNGGSNTLVAVLATVLVMIVLFGVVGIGAFLYFNSGSDNEIAGSHDNTSSDGNDSGENSGKTNSAANAIAKSSPSQSPTKSTAPSPTPSVETSPHPTPDPAVIKHEVSELIKRWKSFAESRNLGPYMTNYGLRVDYYNKKGASRTFVRNDKKKAFEKYTTIQITITDLKVTASTDGKSAKAVFDKRWLFSNSGESNTGKVQTQLTLREIAGNWKIVGERDLKVYYVNK